MATAGGDEVVAPADRSILSDDGPTDSDAALESASADEGGAPPAGRSKPAIPPTKRRPTPITRADDADRAASDDVVDLDDESGREGGDSGPGRH